MRYDFIAEFFAKPTDKEPIYRTRLNEIQSECNFLKDNGFVYVSFNSELLLSVNLYLNIIDMDSV